MLKTTDYITNLNDIFDQFEIDLSFRKLLDEVFDISQIEIIKELQIYIHFKEFYQINRIKDSFVKSLLEILPFF